MFHADYKFSAVGAAASADVLMITGTLHPHLFDVRVSVGRGDCDFFIYEDTTVSSNGSAITEVNVHRPTGGSSLTDLYYTPTVTGVGTKIHEVWFPPTAAGTGATSTGTTAHAGEEWILKPSSNYLFRVTNNSGGTIDIYIEILYYEYPVGGH